MAAMLASAGSASADLLYGADGAGNSAATHLLILDPATGAVARDVGPIGYGVTGLAIDPVTGTLYGVTGLNNKAGTAPDYGSLITINRTTGAGTLVGKEVAGPVTRGAVDITFTPDGNLFGWFETTDDLTKIDKSTGVATVIGNSGLSTYGGGIASNAAGTLFLAGEGEQGPLRTVDPNTGLTTQVATLNGPDPDPGISALAFDSTGKLYGATTPSNSPNLGSTLISIDPTSGALTTIGPAIDRLDAIAFVPSRSVTLQKKLKNGGEKVRLFGQIADTGDPACAAGQSVVVQRLRLGAAKSAKKKKPQTFKNFRTVLTDQSGQFSTKTKVKQSFKYRAFLPESTVCDDATSNSKKVKA